MACGSVALVASSAEGQPRAPNDTPFATLCVVQWSLGPIWAGQRLGCPAVVQPLPSPDRPCRTRYTTGGGTAEEARLRYDAAGRLRAVEHVGRGRATFVYDAEGRLTSHTRQPAGYPPATTTFAYGPGAITDETTGSSERHRWQVEGARVVAEEYVQGESGNPIVSVARTIDEDGVFVGVDSVLCRGPSRDGVRCEPAGPVDRSRVTRDRAGRIVRSTHGDTTFLYTYDARGRVSRIRSASARFRDQTLVDYVCPE